MSLELTKEIYKLAPSSMIELFEVDLTPFGGDVLRFHNGVNHNSQNVVFDSVTFQRFPIEVSGFELTGQGSLPRPKMKVSNHLSIITALLIQYGDITGAKVTRIRTLAKFLDAVNFPGSVNPDADPTAKFDDDIFFIDRKSSENRDFVEFELASAMDLMGIKLPRRKIVQNSCVWKYRSAECGYTGGPVFDINDAVMSSAQSTAGQLVLDTYSAMKTAESNLQVAENALSVAKRNQDFACVSKIVYQGSSYTTPTPGGIWTVTNGVRVLRYSYGWINNKTQIKAYFGGVEVTIGNEYRYGSLVNRDDFTSRNGIEPGWDVSGTQEIHQIVRFQVDSGACSIATSAYSTALSARNSAKSTYDSAVSAYLSALSALPTDDPIYNIERCGKRLSSCQIRFGENNALPFGSFPGVGLFR